MSGKFCGPERERIGGTYDSMEFKLVDIQPLPALNLTTGELECNADPPFCELFIYWPDETHEVEGLKLKYCPVCGERLQPRAIVDVNKVFEEYCARHEN